MSKAERSIQILLFFTFYACLVSLAYSAYGTIEKVDISAPSSARIGEPVEVRATVHTVRSG